MPRRGHSHLFCQAPSCDALKYPSAYSPRRDNLVVFTEHLQHPLDFKLDDVLKRAIQHVQVP